MDYYFPLLRSSNVQTSLYFEFMFQTSLQIKDPTSYKHVTDLNVQRSLSLIPDRKSRQCTRLTVRLSVIKFNHPFHL